MLSSGAEQWVKLNDVKDTLDICGLVPFDGCVYAVGSGGGEKFYVGLPSEIISDRNFDDVQPSYCTHFIIHQLSVT